MEQKTVWNSLYRHLIWKKESILPINKLKGKRVLELGVGTGKTLQAILKQKPSELYAVDFSELAIEKSIKKFGKAANLINADARELPFEDDYFDVVIAHYVLNNSLKEDRLRIMKEIYRVLKREGLCLFEDFSSKDLRNKGEKHMKDKNTIIKKNGLLCHFFDKNEVEKLFEDFSKVKIKVKSFSPIRADLELKRELIIAEAKK